MGLSGSAARGLAKYCPSKPALYKELGTKSACARSGAHALIALKGASSGSVSSHSTCGDWYISRPVAHRVCAGGVERHGVDHGRRGSRSVLRMEADSCMQRASSWFMWLEYSCHTLERSAPSESTPIIDGCGTLWLHTSGRSES